jgi:hypothetical protein
MVFVICLFCFFMG